MKKYQLKASFSVEMSVIAPMIIIIMMMSIMTVFYQHDKNILSAAAYETAVVGSIKNRNHKEIDPNELQELFLERVGRKCIVLRKPSVHISVTDREVSVQGSSGHRRMTANIAQKAVITKPEDYIRKKKRW